MDQSDKSPSVPPFQRGRCRLATAVLLLATAAILLIPAEPPARRVSWEELIAPLAVGIPVVRGYTLAPPRRGMDGDIVYVARRDAGAAVPAGRVEVHILDRGRWKDVPETRSFSVGWEMPRGGALVTASLADANAVRDALRDAIARNDTGFPSVASIALAGEPAPPLIARVLDRLSGLRAVVIGLALAGALALVVQLQRGPLVAGALLFVLGLTLRATELGVPFAHDQDVQRLFTGGLPLRDIVTGAGLEDRHPPLYFLVLHFVQQFGQSEAVGRAPAVLAGALAGPALLFAVSCMGRRIGASAVLAALALTVSPELIAQSRQVSEIPLYALILLAASASLVAALEVQRAMRLITVAASHALAMYTYYLTPFVWAAHAALLMWSRRASKRVVMAFAAGVLAGLPALLLGAVTLLRDWGARDVARAFPGLAWGEHTPLQLAAAMSRIVVDAIGAPFVALALVAIGLAVPRRDLAVLTPALAAGAIFVGTALLSPIARVQSYYVTTVLPLVALAVAVAEPRGRAPLLAWRAALLLAVALFTVPLLARARSLYQPSGDAFMPSLGAAIAQRPESIVITVAQYDKTILAYYLARAEGRAVGWHTIDSSGTKRIEPLLQVHSLAADSEGAALQRLEELLAGGPALVIERDALLLPRIGERLAQCELLLQAPAARLVRCDRTHRSDWSDQSD